MTEESTNTSGEVEVGIKELGEIFDGLDVLADFAGGVMADGKVNMADIDDLVALATKFGTLSEAVSGASEALKEGKNLDQSEVIAILGRVYGVVDKFAKAKKG
jgi:hypothetical protein